MKKKKRKSSSTKKGVLEKYKAAKTKNNVANTGLKSLVDLLLGATLGAGLGAATGRAALPIGVLLMVGSHYFDEETGVLRLAGAATIAYGIGKSTEHKAIAETTAVEGFSLAGEGGKAKMRLTNFKDEVLSAFYLDKLLNKDSSEEIGAVDDSVLDVFLDNNKEEAIRYELDNNSLPNFEDDFSNESEEFAFALIDEEPDLTNI